MLASHPRCGSQTMFVHVENTRHSGAMSVSLSSLRVQKLTLFHASSRKKIFPQNDHFINLICLKSLLIHLSVSVLICRAITVIDLKSSSAISFLFTKVLPTPKATAPFANHSAAFSRVIPPVGMMGI